MSARASVALITIGAVLAFAVRAEPSVIDLQVTGLILMFVGLIRPAVRGWASLRPRAERARPATTGGTAEVPEEPGAPAVATPLRAEEARHAGPAARRVS